MSTGEEFIQYITTGNLRKLNNLFKTGKAISDKNITIHELPIKQSVIREDISKLNTYLRNTLEIDRGVINYINSSNKISNKGKYYERN